MLLSWLWSSTGRVSSKSGVTGRIKTVHVRPADRTQSTLMKSVGGKLRVTDGRRCRIRRQQENCQLISSRADDGRRSPKTNRVSTPRCPTRPFRITATIVLPFLSLCRVNYGENLFILFVYRFA